MRFPCRLLALAQSVIAVGIVGTLHSLTTPPQAVSCAIHTGVRVAIVAAILLAVLFFLAAVGFFSDGRWITELAVVLLVGIAVLVGIDQITAPLDRQIATWATFGGLALLNGAIWAKKRAYTEEAPTTPAKAAQNTAE